MPYGADVVVDAIEALKARKKELEDDNAMPIMIEEVEYWLNYLETADRTANPDKYEDEEPESEDEDEDRGNGWWNNDGTGWAPAGSRADEPALLVSQRPASDGAAATGFAPRGYTEAPGRASRGDSEVTGFAAPSGG